jgi:3-keto-5-aminohexanoate cleavage enzyme
LGNFSYIGPQHVNLSTVALALGGYIRVGIEYNMNYSKEILATYVAFVALVARIVVIAKAVGR